MTDEEMQKKIEFIIDQQAQFAFNIQIHEERLTRIEENLVKHDEKLAKIADNLDRVTGLVGAVAVAQADTEVKQARTEERLNAFIVTVERYISEGVRAKPSSLEGRRALGKCLTQSDALPRGEK